MTKYYWTDGSSNKGVSNTYDEAFSELQKHVDWDMENGSNMPSPCGQTTYFYKNDSEMEADKDGAYAIQITEREVEDLSYSL